MKKLMDGLGGCQRGTLLTYLTLVGVALGTGVGVLMKNSRDGEWSERERMYVSFPGQIFLQVMKAMILPLIVSSIVSAIGTLDLKTSWRIVGRAMVYYMMTTVLAVTVGIILTITIRPGYKSVAEVSSNIARTATTLDNILDLIRNIFPSNLVQGCMMKYQTVLSEPTPEEFSDAAATGKNLTVQDWKIEGRYVEGVNTIGMVTFAISLGISISKMGEGGKPLLELASCMAEATMIMMSWALWLSPVGVASLVTSRVLEIESVSALVKQLGWYIMTILLGLFTHGFVTIPTLFLISTRKLPFKYYYNLTEAIVTAFGTASSGATLPVAMRCVEEKNGVDTRVTKTVMPIGTTINMDGTALYEASAALFIAQLRDIPLGVGSYIIVSLTATLATMGMAGIPQSGLVSLVTVLDSAGLPASDASLIIVVDWLLERFRTAVNVISDSVGVGIVHHLSFRELEAVGPAIDGRRRSSARPGGGQPDEPLLGRDGVATLKITK